MTRNGFTSLTHAVRARVAVTIGICALFVLLGQLGTITFSKAGGTAQSAHAVPALAARSALPGAQQSQAAAALGTSSATSTSVNWAGEVASGAAVSFTSASGDWTVPTVERTYGTDETVTWVGIGTTGANKLVQTGTLEWSGGGQVAYRAFYETLDAASWTYFANLVYPGDHMAATVTEISARHWLLELTDITRGWTTKIVLDYTDGSAASAEWVTERPAIGGVPTTLAAFGSTKFSYLSVAGPNTARAALARMEMTGTTGRVIARPVDVTTATGESFVNDFTPPPPTVTGILPVPGSFSTVRISGQWFYDVDAVHFGTHKAQLLSETETTLTVSVPAAATTTEVTVTTPEGTSKATVTALYWG